MHTQRLLMDPKNPTMLGRFEVKKRLGEGLQGKVYLGWDPGLQREVALKLITVTDADSSFSQDIINEARIAAKISHPNVVPIYEVDMYNNAPLLVFEFVDGVTLMEYIQKNGRFNEIDALSIMVRIAVGLEQAHDQGIVHLDLSPNNIMIDKDVRPRIMDFGLARINANLDKKRYEKEIVGTPRYMSPEHFTSPELTAASDIFTLGLLFYELLMGSAAINNEDIDDIIKAIRNVEIDWGRLQHQGISNEIIAILRDMLQQDPAKRFQTAADLVPELDEAIAIQRSEEQGSLALNFLLRRLERRPEFPACSHSIAEINRLTEEDSNTDFNKLGAVIVRDYSLTNRILKIANSVIFDRGNEGVKTISQAVSRLGLNLVRMICNGLLLFNQADNKESDLKDVLVASFVSGLIAKYITTSIKRSISEEAFICGLFHNLGNHLLIFYLQDEYEDINALIEKGEEVQKAERAILSTTTAALGMAVALKWNFPQTIINCMTRLQPGLLTKPQSDEDILRHAGNFANELCTLVNSNAKSLELIEKVDDFNERHQSIFASDANRLAQLVSATADKFSELAPGLGINYNNSNFCNKLSNFALLIEAAQNPEELEIASA